MGSNPIWGSDFFRVYVFPRIYVVYQVCIYLKIDCVTSGKRTETVERVPQFCLMLHMNATLMAREYIAVILPAQYIVL